MDLHKLNKKIDDLLVNTADLSLKRKAKLIFSEINPQPTDKILEVGCGDGYYPAILYQIEKTHFVGIEVDYRVLDTAERNFKKLGIPYKRDKKWKETGDKGVYLVDGDVNKMPFKSNYFDKIIMSEVAEHLPDDVKGLKEVFRVLKPGGYLILTVPNKNYPFLWDPPNWILQRVFNTHVKSGFWAGIWNQHLRLYTKDHILNSLKAAGFKIKYLDVQTKWSLPFNHHVINFGARMLAAGALPSEVSVQMNKFDSFDPKKRSPIIKLYFLLANFADSFNFKKHIQNGVDQESVGTTIFVKAYK